MPGQPIERAQAVEYLQAVLEGRPNDVPEFRRLQAESICAYWPKSLVEDWGARDGTWHALLEPATRFKQADAEEVHAFVAEYVGLHGRWPSVATLRRFDGRPGNHRLLGESPDQEALPL